MNATTFKMFSKEHNSYFDNLKQIRIVFVKILQVTWLNSWSKSVSLDNSFVISFQVFLLIIRKITVITIDIWIFLPKYYVKDLPVHQFSDLGEINKRETARLWMLKYTYLLFLSIQRYPKKIFGILIFIF